MSTANLKNREVRVRFIDAPWIDDTIAITIGGVGGIGSWSSLFLSRIGYTVILYDMDTVEVHNLGGQCYGANAIGLAKVNAMKDVIIYLCKGYTPIVKNEPYTSQSPASKIMIAGFDNMFARKTMYEKWSSVYKSHLDKSELLFVDGRLSAEGLQIYFVTWDRRKDYEATLFEDSEVAERVCTFASTTHTGAMIGSLITNGITNFVTNMKEGKVVRDVPFRYEYLLPIFTTIIEQ